MASLEFVAAAAAGDVPEYWGRVGVWCGTEIKSTSINLQVPRGFARKFDLLIDGGVCGELWRTPAHSVD